MNHILVSLFLTSSTAFAGGGYEPDPIDFGGPSGLICLLIAMAIVVGLGALAWLNPMPPEEDNDQSPRGDV